MSDSAIHPDTSRERLLPALAAEDFGPDLRVVARGGVRRVIRLELGSYW